MTVGDETFARFLSGDVSNTFGDIEFRNRFGDGRDDVGLALTADDTCCVCAKSWLAAKGTAPFGLAAKGFLGSAGVSGGSPWGLYGVYAAALELSWDVPSDVRHLPLVVSKPSSSDACEDGRTWSLKLLKFTAPVSPSCRVRVSPVRCCVGLSVGLEGTAP